MIMWFQAARVDKTGLLIPGSPGRRCASARLTADGLVLEKAAVSAVLTWDEFSSDWYIASYPRGPGRLWRRSFSKQITTYPAVGSAVYTRRDCAERVTPVLIVLAGTRLHLRAVDPLKHAFERGPVVPLHKPRVNLSNPYRHDATIGFLCRLLHDRPAFRSGLGDHARCEQLRRDILANPMYPVPSHFGLRTKSIEIRNAMRSLRLVHQFGGRPIPGDDLIEPSTAVNSVIEAVALSFGATHRVSEHEVREVLEEDYYSVKPWPFAALCI